MSPLLLIFALCGLASCHVFLYDPPQRSSLWRHKGMDKTGLVVRNNDDMGLNCGGMWKQYDINDGKCGVCGDPYDSSSTPSYPHQYPGKYAKGIIAGCYHAGDRTMDAEVWVTAHHKGYFEFRLCENNDYTKPVTQACLDKNLLTIETTDGESVGTKYYPDKSRADGIYKIKLVLPPGVQCSQCVLQFLYNAGNSWGCSGDDNCGIGNGNQEQFWNCADIAVLPDCNGVIGNIAPIRRIQTHVVTTRREEMESLAHLLSQVHRAVAPVAMFKDESAGISNSKSESKVTSPQDKKERDQVSNSLHAHGEVDSLQREHSIEKLEGSATDNTKSFSGEQTGNRGQVEGHLSHASKAVESSRPNLRQRTRSRARANEEEARIEEVPVINHSHSVDVPVSQTANDVSDSRRADIDGQSCYGSGPWAGDPNMDHWCHVNCARSYCPESTCSCE